MVKLFSRKITVFFLLFVLNFFVGPKPLHSMEQYALPSQDQLVSEVKGLIDSTPTGFTFMFKEVKGLIGTIPTGCTFLLKKSTSNLGVLVSCSWQLLKHPVTSTKQICSKVYETTMPAISIVGRGVVSGYKTVRHPIETLKSVKKLAQNAGSLVLKITLHPVDNVSNVSNVLKAFDESKIEDLPIIGKLSNVYLQSNGFIKITPDSCPFLHDMLMQTAHRLGCENFDSFYLYKGNFSNKVLENLGFNDFSCNAAVVLRLGLLPVPVETFMLPTRGSELMFIGKDLFLGVNPNQASHVPGLVPEQIQGVCAHEMSHYKFRHIHKKVIFTTIIAGFLTWLLIDIFLDSVKNRSPRVNSLYEIVNDHILGSTVCIGVCFKGLKELLDVLFKQGFSRRCEREADTNALRALDNPAAMADGLVKLNSLATLKRRPLLELFQDHPNIGTRVNYLQEEAAKVLKEREDKSK